MKPTYYDRKLGRYRYTLKDFLDASTCIKCGVKSPDHLGEVEYEIHDGKLTVSNLCGVQDLTSTLPVEMANQIKNL